MVLLTILRRRHTLESLEDSIELLGVRKTQPIRNLRYRLSVFEKISTHFVDLFAVDLLQYRPADEGAKSLVERSCRYTGNLGDVFYLNELIAMLANEEQRLADVGIVDQHDIRGRTGVDVRGRTDDSQIAEVFSVHKFRQSLRRAVADGLSVEGDTGERRISEIADKLVVIDAEDRHVAGNVQLGVVAGFDDVSTAVVVAGEKSDGFWQCLYPFGKERQFVLPETLNGPGFGLFVDIAGESGAFDAPGEGYATRLGRVHIRKAAVGIMTKLAVEQMVGRQVADGVVVDDDIDQAVDSAARNRGADGGNFHFDDLIDFFRLAHDDAVDRAAAESVGYLFLPVDLSIVRRLTEEGPGAAFVGIPGDAAQQSAIERPRRRDQQDNRRRAGRSFLFRFTSWSTSHTHIIRKTANLIYTFYDRREISGIMYWFRL